MCVVDGGYLIRSKVYWKKNSKFEHIVRNTVAFVLQHYGSNATVVFDGYPNKTTPKSGVGSSVAVALANKLL